MARGRKERNEAKFREIMQDAQGNVVYTGDLWKISEDGGSGPSRRTMLLAGAVLLMLIVIGSGCIDAENAMGSFYVVIPYIGEISALFGLVWNAFKLLSPSEGVRTYSLEHGKQRIPAACRILTAFALASFILSVLYTVLNGAGDSISDGIAYLMLKLAAAAISEWYRRMFLTTNWKSI